MTQPSNLPPIHKSRPYAGAWIETIDGDSSPFSHGVRFLMRGCYSNDEEKYGMLRKMHIIAHDIESSARGLLTTVAMLNYWDDPRSKMAYIFFRKTR